jgi:hypothetical protein
MRSSRYTIGSGKVVLGNSRHLECGVRVWLYSSVLVLGSVLSAQAQPVADPCVLPVSNPTDVELKLTLKDSQSVYREGEIIPLEYAFAASTNGHYVLASGTYTQRQPGSIDSFCVSPDGRDPLEDYFQSGIWIAWPVSNTFNFVRLNGSPQIIRAELNQWKSLPPGDYTLRVVSNRVGTPAELGHRAGSIVMASNTVAFRIAAATPECNRSNSSRSYRCWIPRTKC